MTDARAQIYANIVGLTKRITSETDPMKVAVLAATIEGLILMLRNGEARPPKRASWERALDRHHLSIVRDT